MGTPGTALLLCLAVCVSALPGEAAQELTTEAPCDGCPRHKKSATLVPAFTKTTTTPRTTRPPTTPPANHTSTPPANHTSTPPANHTMTPPANHTSTPPANHTSTPPANRTTPHTTPPLTPAPPTHPPPPGPAVGDYRVQNGSEVCLRVESALQFRVQYGSKAELWGVFSLRPNATGVSGNCSEDAATLELRFPQGLLSFTFLKNKTRDTVYLSEVRANLSLQFPGVPGFQVSAQVTSLREFEARLGHSYRCQNRSLALSPGLRLDALHEQTQAFALRGGAFGEAEQCPEERRSPLVPIIIGVILLVLILIILIAYLVGRRRTRGGYQTL